VCLGVISACSISSETNAHPLNSYDVQVSFRPRPATTTVDVMVDVSYQGQYHYLSAGESIACDGVQLQTHPDTPTYYGNIPVRTAGTGGAYQCIFTSQGQSATLSISPLAPPTLIAPAAGAALPRVAPFAVGFAPGGSAATSGAITSVGVLAQDSAGQKYYFSAARPAAPESFVVDPQANLRGFAPGPGVLEIDPTATTTVANTGGVHSLVADFSSQTTVAITWT
jgi:hypothetical protein